MSISYKLLGWTKFTGNFRKIYDQLIESEENLNSIFDHPESEIVKIKQTPKFDSKEALVLKEGKFFWAENGKVETEEEKKKK